MYYYSVCILYIYCIWRIGILLNRYFSHIRISGQRGNCVLYASISHSIIYCMYVVLVQCTLHDIQPANQHKQGAAMIIKAPQIWYTKHLAYAKTRNLTTHNYARKIKQNTCCAITSNTVKINGFYFSKTAEIHLVHSIDIRVK